MEADTEPFDKEDIKKFSGPIEPWLTTLNQGFWALEEEYRDTWNKLEPGQVVFFHGSNPEYPSSIPTKIRRHNMGIIGIGRVGAKSQKENPRFLGELQGETNLPLLVHFGEIYWLENINKIREAPVEEKNEDEIQRDISSLIKNLVNFEEMNLECDYRIPPQKSVSKIKKSQCISHFVKTKMEGGVKCLCLGAGNGNLN